MGREVKMTHNTVGKEPFVAAEQKRCSKEKALTQEERVRIDQNNRLVNQKNRQGGGTPRGERF